MNEPTKRLVLDPSKKGNRENAFGAVSMEFENSMVRAALICCLIPLWKFMLRVFFFAFDYKRPSFLWAQSRGLWSRAIAS